MKKIKFFLLTILSALFMSNAAAYAENELYGTDDAETLEVLEGLAARVSQPVVKRAISKAKTAVVNQAATNKNYGTPGQKMLLDQIKKLTPNAQADLDAGRLVFTDSDIYHISKGFTSLSNTINLIEQGRDTFAIGYSSLDSSAKVMKTNDAVVDFISIQVTDYLTAGTVFAGTWNQLRAQNASFSGAVVRVTVDSKTVLEASADRFTEYRTQKDSTVNLDGTGINLRKPILLPAESVVNVELVFANGVTLSPSALSNWGFKVNFVGDGFRLK